MLPDHEIIRRLRQVRHSSQTERNAGRALSINAIAEQARLTRARLYQIINDGSLGSRARKKLSDAFKACQKV